MTPTERLIAEIGVIQCVPVTQLRAEMDRLAQRLIPHLRRQEATIQSLQPATRGGTLA